MDFVSVEATILGGDEGIDIGKTREEVKVGSRKEEYRSTSSC